METLSPRNAKAGNGEQEKNKKVPVQQGTELSCSGMQTPADILAVLSGETAALQ